MKRLLGWSVLAATLSGCAFPPRAYEVIPQFDERYAVAQIGPGPNTVKGSAFLRYRYGGVSTCAGNEVFLIPATDYADTRMSYVYGITRQGLAWPPAPIFFPDLPSYKAAARVTRCDPQGLFQFDKVADGVFYLVTAVPWRVNSYKVEEGSLAQLVTVRGGQVRDIALTGQR